jgi:hypothetical protein
MKRFLLPLVVASLAFTACGNNDADNDTTLGTDTTMASPADGSMNAGATGADGTGTDMGTTDGAGGAGGSMSGGTGSNTPSSNMNNRGGADNSGTGISGGQGNNAGSGSNAAGVRSADGAAPTSTQRNRDDVTNDSLNNRSGMGSSR